MSRKPILDLEPVRGIAKGAKRIQLRRSSLDVQRFGGTPLAQLTYQTEECILQWVMTPAEVAALRRILEPFSDEAEPEGLRFRQWLDPKTGRLVRGPKRPSTPEGGAP